MPYIGNAPYQGVIDSGNIVDGSIQTVDIANSAITSSKLAASSVTTTAIASDVTALISQGGGPKITNIQVTDNTYTVLDDTAVDTAGGYIRITGTGFAAGCQVLVNNVPATSTTFVSATQVRAQVPATAAGTYVIYLVNTDGGVAIRVNGITFSATPTWVTGSTLSDGAVDSAISIQLSATLATTYSLQAGSTLPTGLTLSSSGLISGTVTGLTNDTSYSFTVVATDAENQDSPRTFTITITTAQKVARSLRFNYVGRSTDLSRTFASAGNRKVWTYSVWFKRSRIDTTETLFSYSAGSTDSTWNTLWLTNDNVLRFQLWNSFFFITTQVFRDTAAWYHAVLSVNTNDSTASDRIKIYINGNRVTNFSTSSNPSLGYDTPLNNSGLHYIGKSTYDAKGFDGYMAEVYFIDGQALTPDNFAKTDSITGQWIPKRYTGTYGTNGFYLDFSDNSATTATTLGKDSSGNNNNWTPNAFSVTAGAGNDSLVDSPTNYGTDTGLGGEVRGNYCTLNPLWTYSGPTLSNGNLDTTTTSGAWKNAQGTIGVTSGKWYWECTMSGTQFFSVGVGLREGIANEYPASQSTAWIYDGRGYKNGNNTQISYGTTFTGGDIIGVALDMDAGTLTFYKNGVSQGVAFSTGLAGNLIFPHVGVYANGTTAQFVNFGQRPFAYAAPSGFKALCTHNLPTPAVVKSNTAFDATLWVGDATATRNITGFNFAPDLVWYKSRTSGTYYHGLFDTVRGATKFLATNANEAEITDAARLSAFTANGFTIGNDVGVNASGANMVAWAWDAGTTTVVNTAGTLTANVRVNTTAGISIVTYTGTGSAATVGHALGTTPSMIIGKSRTNTGYNWGVWHKGLQTLYGNNAWIRLNTTDAYDTSYDVFDPQNNTSSVFGIGTEATMNGSGSNYVAYCFAEIPGFSAFGTWTGNGSADGPFVYTGFRPKFILAKQTNTGGQNWYMLDSLRPGRNVTNARLYPNLTNPEDADGNINADFLSNGFKIRDAYTGWNASGGTYIYAAFAEQPFKYSRAR